MRKQFLLVLVALGSIWAISSCRRPIKYTPADPYSCADVQPGETEEVQMPAGMQVVHCVIERRSPDFNGTTGALVRIAFDKVVRPTPSVDDSVNRYVEDFLAAQLAAYGRRPGQSLESWADEYLQAYETYRRGWTGNEPPPAWDLQVDCRIRNPYNQLVSVECTMGGFAGEFHPDYQPAYQRYVVNSITPENRLRMFSGAEEVNHLACALFGENQMTSANVPEEISDPRFPFGPLAWRNNFVFRNDTIVFVFPDYHREPYRMGESGMNILVQGMDFPYYRHLREKVITGLSASVRRNDGEFPA